MAYRESESNRPFVRNSKGQMVVNEAYVPTNAPKRHRKNEIESLRERLTDKSAAPLKAMNVYELSAVISDAGSERIDSALDLASYAHRGQVRKDNRKGTVVQDEYIIHPLRNAARIARWGGDEDQVTIALLHDTVEDAPEKVSEYTGESDPIVGIEKMYGSRVADGIRGMTNDPDIPYRQHVIETCEKNRDVLWAKVSDLKDNAGSLGYMRPGPRRDKLVKKYAPVVDDLLKITKDDGPRGALEDIRSTLKGLTPR